MSHKDTDQMHRYLFEQRHCRGELIQLQDTYAKVIEGHNYPQVIANLLGEALAATCLLTATLKFEGEITLQIQGSGPMSLLVINGRNDQTMRGLARLQSVVDDTSSFKDLIGEGQMVITIAPDQGERYQGIVELSCDTLTGCLEQYFERSEQLPTMLKLFADATTKQCGGMLIQALPEETGSQLDFEHITTLAATITQEELFDLPAQQILHRLFHEEEVILYPAHSVSFQCSCSRERCKAALVSMGAKELSKLFEEQEEIDIHCQYCNSHHIFTMHDMGEVFDPAANSLH